LRAGFADRGVTKQYDLSPLDQRRVEIVGVNRDARTSKSFIPA
jgi:hypothetical protein